MTIPGIPGTGNDRTRERSNPGFPVFVRVRCMPAKKVYRLKDDRSIQNTQWFDDEQSYEKIKNNISGILKWSSQNAPFIVETSCYFFKPC